MLQHEEPARAEAAAKLREERPAPHWPSLLVLIVGMAIVLLPFLFQCEVRNDEFTLVSDALRQARGEVIYRDFFEFITPLSEWPATFVFWLVGPSLLAARALQGLALIVAGLQLRWLARRLGCAPWSATLPGWLLLLALFRTWPIYSHHWLVLPFLLGAVQAAFHAANQNDARWWALAGSGAGLVFLTIQLDGLAVGGALALAILAAALVAGHGLRAVARNLAAFVVGALVPLLGACAYFAWQHALFQAWYDTWSWPLHHYKTPGNENDVTWGADWRQTILPVSKLPDWFGRAYYFLALYALAPATLLLGAAWGARRLYQRRAWQPVHVRFGIAVLVAGSVAAAATRGKCDLVHVAFYSVLPVLLATVFAERSRAAWPTRPFRYALYGLLLLLLATGALLQWHTALAERRAWFQAAGPDAFFRSNAVIRYLRTHSRPHDTLLVIPTGGLYYFYARPPATPFTLIEPPGAHYTTASQYAAAWRSIDARQPKFLVFLSLGGEQAVERLMLRPLAGYQRVRAIRPADGPDFPAYVFERSPGAAR